MNRTRTAKLWRNLIFQPQKHLLSLVDNRRLSEVFGTNAQETGKDDSDSNAFEEDDDNSRTDAAKSRKRELEKEDLQNERRLEDRRCNLCIRTSMRKNRLDHHN